MRILLHDFPGHSFPVQLSRALAARGHVVRHLTFADFPSPKGPLAPRENDPPTLTLATVALPEPFEKYSFVKRWLQERRYAKALVADAEAFDPDVAIGGNAPLDVQNALQAWARRRGKRFVFWLQDVYGVAMTAILSRRLPLLGPIVAWWYRNLEYRLWRRSSVVVPITEDFNPLLARCAVDPDRIVVVENWANLEEAPVQPLENAWRAAHGLSGRRVFLYSGTLGLKHNPDLLADLARRFRDQPDIRVVVVSEGIGADRLIAAKAAEQLDNLLVLPFQPHAVLPDVIASGDVLVVLLEPDAGIYSVPSKTLTYLCAERAILGSIPTANLASRLIVKHQAGKVADPSDQPSFLAAAAELMADPEGRARMGKAGRAYAEAHFDIDRIADRFEALLNKPD
jgi:glycosyltransferase involved in cell wall biosynthesis